jgi:hypothetical protein
LACFAAWAGALVRLAAKVDVVRLDDRCHAAGIIWVAKHIAAFAFGHR